MIANKHTTLFDGGVANQITTPLQVVADDDTQEVQLLNLYPDIRYQTIDGFGGAITEAAGSVLRQMPEETVEKILQGYFGAEGLRYNFVRTHLDSCDFSLGNYSAVTDPQDKEFKTFSLARDEKYILPYIQLAEQYAGHKIGVMLTPWSPPAFMKTNNDRNHGGKLLPEYADAWANYICRYIKKYESHGITVEFLTVQNEPHATQTWDSCRYTHEEEREFLEKHLYPALQEAGLGKIKINMWDHNKERLFDCANDMMTVLLVQPGKHPVEITIPHTLKELQKQVGGTIEIVYPWPDRSVGLVCHDEGKLLGLPLNRALPEIGDAIAGDFLLCGLCDTEDGGSLCSLPPEQMSYMKQHFREPHFFIESAEGNDYFRVTPKVYDNLMGKPKKKPSREQGER